MHKEKLYPLHQPPRCLEALGGNLNTALGITAFWAACVYSLQSTVYSLQSTAAQTLHTVMDFVFMPRK
jgi:hypothetical protein